MVPPVDEQEIRRAFRTIRENLSNRVHGINTPATIARVGDHEIAIGALRQLVESGEVIAHATLNGPLFTLKPRCAALKLVVDNKE